jgi:hypothetical protein
MMNRRTILNLFATLSAVIAIGVTSLAGQQDVTGTWKVTVESQAGTGNPTVVLKQDGEKLTGTYKGQLGEAPLQGTIKGSDITFSFKVNVQGQDLQVDYVGTVEGGKSMKGKVKLGDFGEGTFTGTKD